MSKKLEKYSKEELEVMSYNDIANIILSEKSAMPTLDIFKQIAELLDLSQRTIENKIGEFYTALTSDKRFILLEDGKWDLTVNHKTQNLTIEDDLEDYDEAEEYDDLPEEPEENEDVYSESDETDDDIADVTEEYKNLVIVEESELEEN